jgi:hypothetical protein
MLSKGELMQMLVKNGQHFVKRWEQHLRDGRHMHELGQAAIDAMADNQVDAIVTMFINYVGMQQGVDLALYAPDLRKEE